VVLVSPSLSYVIKYVMTAEAGASTGGVIDIDMLRGPTCLTTAVGFFRPTETQNELAYNKQ